MSDIEELRQAAQEARTAYDRASDAAHYDVAMPAPPSAMQVRRLERAVLVAAKKLNLTWQAFTDAVAAGPPKRNGVSA